MLKIEYKDILIEFTNKLLDTKVEDMNQEDIDSLKDLAITLPYVINETDIVLYNISKILETNEDEEFINKQEELNSMKAEYIKVYELLEKKLAELTKKGLIK